MLESDKLVPLGILKQALQVLRSDASLQVITYSQIDPKKLEVIAAVVAVFAVSPDNHRKSD